LLSFDARVSAVQVAAANHAAASFNEVVVVERGFQDATRSIRIGASVFVALLSLALVALITALVLGESDTTITTLRALGARS
jgi:hypothetical protein